MEIICSSCHTKNQSSDNFCYSCGTTLSKNVEDLEEMKLIDLLGDGSSISKISMTIVGIISVFFLAMYFFLDVNFSKAEIVTIALSLFVLQRKIRKFEIFCEDIDEITDPNHVFLKINFTGRLLLTHAETKVKRFIIAKNSKEEISETGYANRLYDFENKFFPILHNFNKSSGIIYVKQYVKNKNYIQIDNQLFEYDASTEKFKTTSDFMISEYYKEYCKDITVDYHSFIWEGDTRYRIDIKIDDGNGNIEETSNVFIAKQAL